MFSDIVRSMTLNNIYFYKRLSNKTDGYAASCVSERTAG